MRGQQGAVRAALAAVAVSMLVALVALSGASLATESRGAGSIDYVESDGTEIGVLYSLLDLPDGVTADLSTLQVTVDGDPVEATAELAATADTETTVRRTAVLAIDVSQSMQGERFAEAKRAAEAFLTDVSPDVYVGVVAFAGDVTTVQPPSLDRAESVSLLNELTLSRQTRLYDGVLQAVDAAGGEGQRSVLILSDGRDTSRTELEAVVTAVADAGIKVDVVALGQAADGLAPLESIAGAGDGTVLPADDPDALTALFESQAEALAQQVLVTAELPAGAASEGTLGVSLNAGGQTYFDTAFVPLSTDATDAAPSGPTSPAAPGLEISRTMMLVGLGGAGIGIMLLLLHAFGVLGGDGPPSVEDRIAAYSQSGSNGGSYRPSSSAGDPSHGFARSAVGVAEKALATNASMAATIGARLEAAGMSLKPAEWVLMHAGIALLLGFVGLALGAGSSPLMLTFLAIGAVLPWLYLGFKRTRRVSAFNNQLADTLQLLAGGLSAGLSLAQSVDTVVRQGSEPMTTEFKRALVEARLGVSLEDALDSIAERMRSTDFKWVVISVRIQREVGGNLAEVLGQVADTIRERAYLQRQVKSLSAEGKMSAWILGLLPIVVMTFLMLTNPTYFEPMFSNVLGWMMLGLGGVLMVLATFWMRKLIRMEV